MQLRCASSRVLSALGALDDDVHRNDRKERRSGRVPTTTAHASLLRWRFFALASLLVVAVATDAVKLQGRGK